MKQKEQQPESITTGFIPKLNRSIKINITLIILLLLVIYNLIENMQKDQLSIYLAELDSITPVNQKYRFAKSSLDSIYINFEKLIINTEYEILKSKINPSILSFHNESVTKTDNENKIESVCFYYFLNNKKIEPRIIIEKIKSIDLIIEDIRKHKFAIEENRKINDFIYEENFKRLSVGDFISICLPLYKEYGVLTAYYSNGFPYSKDYSYANDSIQVCCKIIEKKKSLKFNQNTFIIKIDSVDHVNVKLLGSPLNQGTNVEFLVQYYGRKLIKIHDGRCLQK
jgi:hypothetical protein